MKRYSTWQVILNSNVLVLYGVAASMLLTALSEKYDAVACVGTISQVVFSVLFAVYVEWRLIYKKQRIAVFCAALMMVLENMLVQMKYSFFRECETVARNLWYAYYVPYMLIPLFILFAAMFVGEENKKIAKPVIAVTSLISTVLSVLVMTNDLHQWMFRFRDNFENWDAEYTYGFLFIPVYLWIVLLFVNAFIALIRKSRIIVGKKHSWQVLLYVGIIWLILVLDAVTPLQERIFGTRLISSSTLFCALSISFLLTCIRLCLIPAEVDYYQLNDAIEEVNEQLKEEGEIIRLRNELKREQMTLKEKNELYDKIAQSVTVQSEKILALTETNGNLPLICFYGAYIKRLSNLELIAFDNAQMSVYELLLSVNETEKYLQKAGIPTNVTGYSERFVKSEIIVETYKYMQTIIENRLESLKGISVSFPKDGRVLMRAVLEGVRVTEAATHLSDDLTCFRYSEDDISYIIFSMGEVGK